MIHSIHSNEIQHVLRSGKGTINLESNPPNNICLVITIYSPEVMSAENETEIYYICAGLRLGLCLFYKSDS